MTAENATAAIEAALKKGMDAVAELDVIVANTLRDKAGLRARWDGMRHVQRMPRKNKAASAGGDSEAAAE
jgi:hypothetical protein